MQSPPIVAGPYLIDPEWMTSALRASGDLPHGQVTDVHSRPVGNGLVGDSFRFELKYEGAPEGAPSSVVGKFPAEDAASRASGAGLRLYLREVSFYRDVAKSVDISTPAPSMPTSIRKPTTSPWSSRTWAWPGPAISWRAVLLKTPPRR